MALKPIIKWPLIILSILIIAYLVLRMFVPMTNVAETSPANPDTSLVTRYYPGTFEEVHKTVDAAIPEIKTATWGGNWKVVERNPAETVSGTKQIFVEVPVVIFTDDMTITVREDKGRVAIDARSASHVGKSDFGENRRHIIQLFEMLDKKFGAN